MYVGINNQCSARVSKDPLPLSLFSKKAEMAKATDMVDFYKVPADYRDLNYTKYVQEDGNKSTFDEYNSHNTNRLNIKELKRLLLTLDYVQNELKATQ